ncbi:MAG: nucleotide exchange factor GrpE [Cyanobacteria bacterium SIG28]|nr:nucleotide exchange factor GrpE [Cyanobacteria bacterium SIG28]
MQNPFKKAVDETENNNENNIEETETIETTEAESSENSEEITETPAEEVQEEKNPWQEKYETLNNQYLRLAADFDNYRKRQEQERENLLKYGAENTVKKLIEVLDNFDRGLKAIETVDDCDKVKECYNLAYKNFNDVLAKIGLEVIKAEGEEFDPNLHEAVMRTPTDEKPENTIIAELQKGYKLGDKVLRPTLVNVATEQ